MLASHNKDLAEIDGLQGEERRRSRARRDRGCPRSRIRVRRQESRPRKSGASSGGRKGGTVPNRPTRGSRSMRIRKKLMLERTTPHLCDASTTSRTEKWLRAYLSDLIGERLHSNVCSKEEWVLLIQLLVIGNDDDVLQYSSPDNGEEDHSGTSLVGLFPTCVENRGTLKDLAPWSDCTNEDRLRRPGQICQQLTSLLIRHHGMPRYHFSETQTTSQPPTSHVTKYAQVEIHRITAGCPLTTESMHGNLHADDSVNGRGVSEGTPVSLADAICTI